MHSNCLRAQAQVVFILRLRVYAFAADLRRTFVQWKQRHRYTWSRWHSGYRFHRSDRGLDCINLKQIRKVHCGSVRFHTATVAVGVTSSFALRWLPAPTPRQPDLPVENQSQKCCTFRYFRMKWVQCKRRRKPSGVLQLHSTRRHPILNWGTGALADASRISWKVSTSQSLVYKSYCLPVSQSAPA